MVRYLFAFSVLLFGAPVLADRFDDAINASNRPERDLRGDELRRPAEVLREIGIEEGSVVLDLGAGGGYYSEMFATLVGESGEVIMQNPSQLYTIFPNLKAALTEQRLGADRLPNVRLIDAESTALGLTDDSVDLAFFHLIYHDHFWLYPDQAEVINAEIARVVKPGGRVVIIDHAAPEGTGAEHALSREDGIHRVDASFVQGLLAGAGFVLDRSSGLLETPQDNRTQAFFAEELRGKPTDRFFHIYRKP